MTGIRVLCQRHNPMNNDLPYPAAGEIFCITRYGINLRWCNGSSGFLIYPDVVHLELLR
jgi:hypothetical protein